MLVLVLLNPKRVKNYPQCGIYCFLCCYTMKCLFNFWSKNQLLVCLVQAWIDFLISFICRVILTWCFTSCLHQRKAETFNFCSHNQLICAQIHCMYAVNKIWCLSNCNIYEWIDKLKKRLDNNTYEEETEHSAPILLLLQNRWVTLMKLLLAWTLVMDLLRDGFLNIQPQFKLEKITFKILMHPIPSSDSFCP